MNRTEGHIIEIIKIHGTNYDTRYKKEISYWSKVGEHEQVCSIDYAIIYPTEDKAWVQTNKLLSNPNKDNWVHQHKFSVKFAEKTQTVVLKEK